MTSLTAASPASVSDAENATHDVLDAMTAMIIVVEADGTVSRANHAAREAMQLSFDGEAKPRVGDIAARWDSEILLRALETTRREGRPTRVDRVPMTSAKGERVLAMTLTPLDRPAGSILVQAADVTERRMLERRVMQAERLESIGMLAAGVAHEINTPIQYVGDNIRFLHEAFTTLTELVGRLGVLCRDGSLDHAEVARRADDAERAADLAYFRGESAAAATQALDGVDRVTKIVRALREFSHPGGADKRPCDVNHAVETTVTVARNEWRYVAELELDLAADLPPVVLHGNAFNQVVLNLVVNAAQAVSEAIGGETEKRGRIKVSTRREGAFVEIRVADSGRGIPPEIRSRIFDPFFTTKDPGKGTGQGLAIAYDVVVNRHGGTIDFESATGKGATFVVRMPIDGGPEES
jgi:two-component system, NtrC family, sensor kinase